MNDRDKATIDFAGQWFKFAGAKESAIRERFDETPTRFYQRLGVLLDDPEAVAYDAVVVGRLRRLRAARRGVRTFGNGAADGMNGDGLDQSGGRAVELAQ